MEEKFDVLNELGEFTGEIATRDECHKKGCYFLLNFKNYQLYDLKKFKSLFASEENNCIKQDKANTIKTYVIYKKIKKKANCVISH